MLLFTGPLRYKEDKHCEFVQEAWTGEVGGKREDECARVAKIFAAVLLGLDSWARDQTASDNEIGGASLCLL